MPVDSQTDSPVGAARAPGLTGGGIMDAQISLHSRERVRLRNSVSGRRVCWPGVGRLEHEYAVPGSYEVRQLLGCLVFMVEDDDSVNSQGDRHRVVAVLSARYCLPAPPNYSLFECADERCVVDLVMGEHVVEFAGFPVEERELVDLEEVEQPPTPDPFEG